MSMYLVPPGVVFDAETSIESIETGSLITRLSVATANPDLDVAVIVSDNELSFLLENSKLLDIDPIPLIGVPDGHYSSIWQMMANTFASLAYDAYKADEKEATPADNELMVVDDDSVNLLEALDGSDS